MKKRLRESKILDPLQWKSDASDDNVISILNKKVKVVASPSDNHSQIRNQRSILIVLFRDLDNVLNEFHRKGRTAFWVHIKPAIECCTNGRIALDDVACLIAIDPSAYSLTWQLNNSSCSSSKYELCLSFGVPSRGKSLQAESRLQAFSEKLDAWYSSHSDEILTASSTSIVPPKPKDFGMQKSNFRQKVEVSGFLPSYTKVDGAELEKLQSGGLEGLRQLAFQRESQRENKEQMARQAHEQTVQAQRLQSLVDMCDALRSKYVAARKTSMKASDLLNQIAKELYISKAEALIRLKLLCQRSPEFVSIMSPDSIVPFTTVRLNFDINYVTFRKKVVQQLSG